MSALSSRRARAFFHSSIGSLGILFGLALGGCSAGEAEAGQDVSFEKSPDGVMLEGPLGEAAAKIVSEQLLDNGTLVVNSRGGSRDSARQIGATVARRNATVDVNSSCFSACALYLALPASHVLVGRGATLLFHSTPELWVRLSRERPDLFGPDETARIRQDLAMLKSDLIGRGVDPEILSCIDRASRPREETLRLSSDSQARRLGYTDDATVTIRSEFDAVWLSPSVLKSFGADNLDISWSLSPTARPQYESLKGLKIAWVDDPSQCQAADGGVGADR